MALSYHGIALQGSTLLTSIVLSYCHLIDTLIPLESRVGDGTNRSCAHSTTLMAASYNPKLKRRKSAANPKCVLLHCPPCSSAPLKFPSFTKGNKMPLSLSWGNLATYLHNSRFLSGSIRSDSHSVANQFGRMQDIPSGAVLHHS